MGSARISTALVEALHHRNAKCCITVLYSTCIFQVRTCFTRCELDSTAIQHCGKN